MLAAALVAAMATPASAISGTTRIVSTGSGGSPGNSSSQQPSISADGAHVAFISDASDLVMPDANGLGTDIYVRDTGSPVAITRVSVDSVGTQGNGTENFDPHISGNGRFVTFWSNASNLVAADTNTCPDPDNPTNHSSPGTCPDVFLHDRDLSGSGTFDTPGNIGTWRVSVPVAGGEANGPSYSPSISSDASTVAFVSEANNLVLGDSNGREDVFVCHLKIAPALTDATPCSSLVRASVDGSGSQARGGSVQPSLTANGSLVSFTSDADNLVANDTNNAQDVFLRDMSTGAVTLVSVGGQGQGNLPSYGSAITGDGKAVAFTSLASNLAGQPPTGPVPPIPNIFVRDLVNGLTTLVSVSASSIGGVTGIHELDSGGNDASDFPSVSKTATCPTPIAEPPLDSVPTTLCMTVAFQSKATDLVTKPVVPAGIRQVYQRNLAGGTVDLVSENGAGTAAGNLDSEVPSVSGDGSLIAFDSLADNLTGDDNLGAFQVYERVGDSCPAGEHEDGPISAPMRSVYTQLGPPLAPPLQEINCDVVVQIEHGRPPILPALP